MKEKNPDGFEGYALALTEFEAANKDEYETMSGGTVKSHMLNQNPRVGRGISSGVTYMHTLIKNAGVEWVSPLQAFMTAEEMLLMNGIPTRAEFGPGGTPCSSFCHPRTTKRTRTAMAAQAGNTMNVAVCGVFWVYCLGVVTRTRGSTPKDIVAAAGRASMSFLVVGTDEDDDDDMD